MQSLRKFLKRPIQICLVALLCVALLLPMIGTSFVFEADAAPVATITFNNPISASGGIALVGNQGDCQTRLTNVGGYAVMEPLQYAYFTVSNASILNASALTMEITFFDNTTSNLNVQYASTNGAYYGQSIERYGSNELVTTTLALSNADFDAHTQNCGAKFRISGGGNIRSISISLGVTDDTQQGAPAFAPQTTSNDLIGKGVAGYQAWFRAGNSDNEWGHWGGNGSANPAANQLSFEIYPSVNEYKENGATLYPSKLANLGNGEDSLLFNSTDPAVIDTHFKWMQQYDIDGAAVQRFYANTSTAKTTAKNHLQTIKEKAEKYNRLFYVMYDFSGCGSHDQATFLRTVQLDFIYNVENKGVASSSAYAHADGKPVVCFWGIAGESEYGYVYGDTAIKLIQWFKDRGYYVIVGTPDNQYTTRTGTNLTPFTMADMISPWTVGRYGMYEYENWLNHNARLDLDFCNKYGAEYQPVVFSGFGWTNMGNNGGINAFPHYAGQFLWAQAYKLKSMGAKNIYFAMFDEYDEGTAHMKGATDYFEIPTDQYFMTYAADGWWLSNDFYLRAAGAVIDMMQGKTATRPNIDIPHSQGPVYWRNSFESRTTTYYDNGVQKTGVGKLDVCLNNPAVLSTSAVALSGNAIVTNRAKSGQSSFRLNGNSSGNGTAFYKIADTVINTNESLKLTYWLYAANNNGRDVFVDLLFGDGSRLSNVNSSVTAAHGTTGQWSEVTVDVGRAAAGKTITGIIVGYEGAGGSFDAYVDDITLATSSSEGNVSLNMTQVNGSTAFVDYSNATYANMDAFQFGDDPTSGSTVNVNGRTAAKFTGYLYLNVSENYIGANDNNVTVRITYLDNDGGEPIKLQYNSNDPNAFPAQDYTDYMVAGTASGAWRTVDINLTNASFRNTQNGGCDLRIGNNTTVLYVSRVEIVNTAKVSDPEVTLNMTAANGSTAYVDYSNATYSKMNNFVFGDDPTSGSTVNVNGRTAAKFTGYLYLNVDDSYIGANDNNVTVRITYLDNTAGEPIKLQYNSNDPNAFPAQDYTDYMVAGTASGAWRTVDINLTNASFRNTQNGGCDLRIGNNGEQLYVSRVEIVNNTAPAGDTQVSLNMTAVNGSTAYVDYSNATYSKMNNFVFGDDPTSGSTVNVNGRTTAKFTGYLYLNVDDSYIGANDNNVIVRITYLDNTAGEPIKLQYNSNDPNAFPVQDYTDYMVAGTNSGAWRTVDINLNNASFRNTQNGGCDLRIGNNGDVLYVSRVEIVNNTASNAVTTSKMTRYGRTYENGDTLQLFWTNSGFSFTINGTGATATLTSNNTNATYYGYLNVYVDGGFTPYKTICLTNATQTVALAEGLPQGIHTIEVRKRNEAAYGGSATIGVRGVTVVNGTVQNPPAAPTRKIEVIGDSITGGFGNMVTDNTGNYTTATQDGTMTYAVLAAKELGANASIVSRSGIGFCRNASCDSMYTYYDKVASLPGNNANGNTWDFNANPSDVVVINLGTNDNGATMNGAAITDAQMTAEAVAFLQLVRQKNPNAVIIWTYGMMGGFRESALRAAVQQRVNAGDNKVFYLPLESYNATTEGVGTHGHPTIQTDINRSIVLANFIAEKTGWAVDGRPMLQAQLQLSAQYNNGAYLAPYSAASVKAFTDAIAAGQALVNANASKDQFTAAADAIWKAFLGLTTAQEMSAEYLLIDSCETIDGVGFGDAVGTPDTNDFMGGNAALSATGSSGIVCINRHDYNLAMPNNWQNWYLDFWLYVSDPAAITGGSCIEISEVVDEIEMQWGLNTLGLKAGWNKVQLPLSGGNASFKTLKNIRLFVVDVTRPLTIKLDHVALSKGRAAANTAAWETALNKAATLLNNQENAALRAAYNVAQKAVSQADVDAFTTRLNAEIKKIEGDSVAFNPTAVSGSTAFVDYSNATYANMDNFFFGDDPTSGSVVNVNGRTAAKFSGYLYLNVNEGYIGANDANVIVRITYLDNTTGEPIKLQYNSNDPNAFPVQDYTDYMVAGNGSGAWRTAEIVLTNASFRNTQNGGCDLRIGNNTDFLYVSRVEIVNNTTQADASITFSGNSNSGNGMALIDSGTGDCVYTATTYNNTAVRRIDNYLYATVSNQAVKNAARLEVEIAYYDVGNVNFTLQYNAIGENYKGVSFATGNTGALLSHTFTLEDAAFSGSQNYGADFRIAGANLYVQSIKIRVLNDASIRFADIATSNGLTLIDNGVGDCAYSATTINGNAVYKVDNYLYCKIDNATVKNASAVKVVVTYYDNGDGNITFQYNAKSSSYQGVNAQKGNTGGLNTATFTLTDVAFNGSQNYGADFRIAGNDVYLKSIVITPIA